MCKWKEINSTATNEAPHLTSIKQVPTLTFISTSPRSSSSNDPNVSKTAFVFGLTWILRAEKNDLISKDLRVKLEFVSGGDIAKRSGDGLI
jgi:hypothetical protein